MDDRACYKMSVVRLCRTGKMQIARWFAYMVKESCSKFSISYLPELSTGSFGRACTEFVRHLGITQVSVGKDNVKETFEQYLGTVRVWKWLLVVSDADSTDIFL